MHERLFGGYEKALPGAMIGKIIISLRTFKKRAGGQEEIVDSVGRSVAAFMDQS